MTSMRKLSAIALLVGLLSLAMAQNAAPKRLTTADANNHVGETAAVCGTVVDSKVEKNGLYGHGFPVSFYLDQPEPTAVFYFIAFGTQKGGPQEAIAAYKGKRLCVTGKIESMPSGGSPFILAANRSQAKVEPAAK